MRLTAITVHHVRIPLRRRVRHASHARSETDSLVVRCQLDGGAVGWGEGLPRPYVTGEDIDAAYAMLTAPDALRPLAAPFDGLSGAVALLDGFRLAPPESRGVRGGVRGGVRDCFGNSARCAVEVSVLDAVTRALGVPLSAVTQALPETAAIRAQRESVRYSGAVTAESPRKQIWQAVKMRLFGFAQVKVKVGAAGIDDAAALRRVRRVVGRRVDLRIDANEAWTCAGLESRLAPLLPVGITALEQPVPHADVAGLAAVRPRLGVPLMLDESLCSLGDGRRAIDEGLCDLFNVRLSKCGGFVPSLRLAAMAHAAGLGYQLGCQVGETGILSAAGRHFATSVAGLRYTEGSFDRFLVRERLTREDLTFGYGGHAPALTGPGLGVTVDEAALERVTIRRTHRTF
jgi:muconate cycloisomerase